MALIDSREVRCEEAILSAIIDVSLVNLIEGVGDSIKRSISGLFSLKEKVR